MVQDLLNFNTACDEFISGKYILVDMKIASILKIISEDEKIKDIVSACLDNYDFNSEFKLSTMENGESYALALPNDEKKLVAFVYSLLYKFKNNEINFYDFLNKFYNTDDDPSKEFSVFAQNVIIPFKNALNNMFSKRHVLVDSDDYQNNYYNKIKQTVRLIAENINNFKLSLKEKEEFSMLLNSLFQASERNDKKTVYSLMIGLDYFSKANKKTRNAYLSLEECFV